MPVTDAGSPNSNVVAASTADGDLSTPLYALYPDAVGGYVLIVQQSAAGTQNDVSGPALVTGTGNTITLARSSSSGKQTYSLFFLMDLLPTYFLA